MTNGFSDNRVAVWIFQLRILVDLQREALSSDQLAVCNAFAARSGLNDAGIDDQIVGLTSEASSCLNEKPLPGCCRR
jgi:hypothetical protein